MNQTAALQTLIQALEGAGVRYLIGGSVASSSRGLPRATLATDLLVELTPASATSIANSLGAQWYMDVNFAQDSIQRGRAFNVIHLPSGHKFDLFPASSPFHAAELLRATVRRLALSGGDIQCFVATAEDMILAKLQWYRQGGEVSDRQCTDVTGMLVTNSDLDRTYLDHWAGKLGLVDLLRKAIEQSAR
jgi:hypothetical protein